MKKLLVFIILGLMMSSCSLFLYDYQTYTPVHVEYQSRPLRPIYRGTLPPPHYYQHHNHYTAPPPPRPQPRPTPPPPRPKPTQQHSKPIPHNNSPYNNHR